MHKLARLSVIVGVIGANALMLYRGRHNAHLDITLLFVVWVTAPYVALAWAIERSRTWPDSLRTALDWVSIVITIVIIGAFAYVAFGAVPKVTLIVLLPPLAIAVVAALYLAAAMRSRAPDGG